MIDFAVIEYMLALWYVAGPRGDFMAAVFRERGDSRWQVRYRFRYYAGTGDPFSGDDKKNWYAATAEKPEQQMLADFDLVAGELAKGWGSQVDRVDVRGGQSEFFAKAGGRPWLHMSTEPA